MELAGKYSNVASARQMVAYPREVAPDIYVDQYTLVPNDLKRYEQGDHLIWGGRNAGMFWASDVQTTTTLQPKPIEHAYQVIAQANEDIMRRQLPVKQALQWSLLFANSK